MTYFPYMSYLHFQTKLLYFTQDLEIANKMRIK